MTIATIIVALIILTGCAYFRPSDPDRNRYGGNYPELYSVAIHSLLSATGDHPVLVIRPLLVLVDEDLYGRRLFFYSEGARMSATSLIISQKSSEHYAYFYFLDNFHSFSEEEIAMFSDGQHGWWTRNLWPEDVVQELKERNSWNQPINHDRLTRVEITRRKPDVRAVSDEQLVEAHMEIREMLGINGFPMGRSDMIRRFILFAVDDFGRSIHYISLGHFYGHSVIHFYPDGSFNLDIGLKGHLDPYNYRDQLLEFMQQNNWNMPLE